MGIAQKYTIRQTSQQSSSKMNFYDWEVWIEDGTASIENIKKVEYILHSSFKSRVQERTNAENQFKLKARGWDEFMIQVKITEQDDTVIQLRHWLDLGGAASKEAPPIKGGPLSEEETKKVFLSYDSANARLGKFVEDQLLDLGMEVRQSGSFEYGKTIKESVEDAISSADAVIVIKGDKKSIWQEDEIELARAGNKKLISIEESEIQLSDIDYGTSQKNKAVLSEKLRGL